MISDLQKVIFKHNALPASLTFFVTNKCNLTCKHCFYWASLNQKNNELTLEEIDRFSKSLGSITNINIGGGEPFARPDIADVIKTLIRNLSPLKVIIVSNGSMPKRIIQAAEEILKESATTHITFHFSIDDYGEAFEEFRGMKGLMGKIKETVNGIKELRKTYDNFNIGVTMTVNPVNQERVQDVYRYILKEIDPDTVSPILMRSTSDKLDSKDVDVKHYEDLVKLIKSDTQNHIIKGHHNFKMEKVARNIHYYKHKMIAETVKRDKYFMPCYAGILSGVIYENGNVVSCEILNWKIGNLRDYDCDFKKLWLSDSAVEVRRRIKEKKCFCTYECAMDVNVAYNAKNLLMANLQG